MFRQAACIGEPQVDLELHLTARTSSGHQTEIQPENTN